MFYVLKKIIGKVRRKDFIKGQITTKESNKTEKLRIIKERKYLPNKNFKHLKTNLDLFYDNLKILHLKACFGISHYLTTRCIQFSHLLISLF